MPKRRYDVVVVLESMWDWRSMTSQFGYTEAPAYFRINPHNHSGKRLHFLLQGFDFVVTNACRELVGGPNEHGTPDPKWLADNLNSVEFNKLLVCGRVAWNTYIASGYSLQCRQAKQTVVKIKHPAARDWTKEEMDRWQQTLAKLFR